MYEVDWATLPVPTDDGATAHLRGMAVPSIGLVSTDGETVDLSAQEGLVVVFIYPWTGKPGTPMPGGWDNIPGARGCTPQSCAFRDSYAELKELGVMAVFGLSTQDTDYQREARQRLHLPYALLSDAGHTFGSALKLPVFQADGLTLYKRVTLILRNGMIEHVFYPVFPPDRNATDVIGWIKTPQTSQS